MSNEQNNMTGLVIRGSYVEWTSLRAKKGSFEITAQERTDADLPEPIDLDQDGAVGFTDLIAVLSAWGPCP